MLKTSSTKSAKPRKSVVGVNGGNRVECDRGELDGNRMDDVEIDGDEVGDDEIGKKGQKISKNLFKSKKTIESDFLTPGAKLAFIELKQTFFKASILHHLDSKRYIQIKIDALGYAIGGVLNQLISDNSSRWHLVAFFSQKMIPAETRYETLDSKLLAIVESFKTWKHYLKGSQHEVFMLTNHNNLRQFMNTKSLSSRQVRWAQELSCYHFQIDYYQSKANKAANTLSQYPQQSAEEEKALQAENVKILHRL